MGVFPKQFTQVTEFLLRQWQRGKVANKFLNIHQNVELAERHKDGLFPFLAGLCPFKKILTEKKVDKYLMPTTYDAVWKQKMDGIIVTSWIYFMSCLNLYGLSIFSYLSQKFSRVFSRLFGFPVDTLFVIFSGTIRIALVSVYTENVF